MCAITSLFLARARVRKKSVIDFYGHDDERRILGAKFGREGMLHLFSPLLYACTQNNTRDARLRHFFLSCARVAYAFLLISVVASRASIHPSSSRVFELSCCAPNCVFSSFFSFLRVRSVCETRIFGCHDNGKGKRIGRMPLKFRGYLYFCKKYS